MKLFPDKLSDEELLERARKSLLTWRWARPLNYALCAIGLLAVSFFILSLLLKGAELNFGLRGFSLSFCSGFLLGIAWGIALAFSFERSCSLLSRFLARPDAETLLLKSYDAAKARSLQAPEDENYMEALRRSLGASAWRDWLWLGLAALLTLGFIALVLFASHLVGSSAGRTDMTIREMESVLFNGAMFLGLELGFIFLVFLASIAAEAYATERKFRFEALLVKYADLLKDAK